MSFRTRARSTLWSALRFASFLALLLTIVLLLLLKQARAAVDEALLGVGASAMEYPGARAGDARQLRLNGARLYFRTQTIDAGSHSVLDHYEASCDNGATFAALATISAREAGRGYVACLDVAREASTLDGLVSGFVRFSRTGDIHELGQVRYAYAQPIEGSEGNRTFLLTMWTEDGLNLYEVLPREGRDAAGRDLGEVPRPPDSQRILSSSELGRSSSVAVYLAKASSTLTLQQYYRAAFRARGWEILERHVGERLEVDQTSLVTAQRGDDLITVLTHPSTLGRTVVTILMVGTP